MKIVILVVGSRGDAAPMSCLASELVRRGLPTTVVALRELAPWTEGTGAQVVAVGPDAGGGGGAADGAPGTPRELSTGGGALAHRRLVSAWLEPLAAPMAQAELDVVEPGDLVVGGVLSLDDLCALRQARGCRPVLTLMSPLHPSDDGAGSLMPVRPRGRTRANRWAGALAVMSAAGLCTTTGRALRRRLGLPATSARGYLRELSSVPTLQATSPAIVPLPDGLPGPVWQTGFWSGDPSGATGDVSGAAVPGDLPPRVPAGLATLLADGEPPVLLGFGSMPSPDPDADVRLLARAARLAGRRAVVRRPSRTVSDPAAVDGGLDGGLDGGPGAGLDGAGDVFVIGSAPYGWLLPQVAAVVHHGGAGTLAAALRADRPNLAVPFGVDQPYYGRRLHELGVGPAPIPRRRLTAERLGAALTAMTSGPDAAAHRAAAAALGGRLRQDPGVVAAADRLAELVVTAGG